MAAAAWTETAKDITRDRKVWKRYLTAQQLSDRIGLSVETILDVLTRNPQDDDPRSAIVRPAARIGPTRLAAVPMWAPAQSRRYLELAAARPNGGRRSAVDRSELPVYSLEQAAEEGLASAKELAKILGIAENSIRRWAREEPDFPPEVAVAERIPPFQFGPPRVLRSIGAVRDWVLANARLDDEHRARLEADLAGTPAA